MTKNIEYYARRLELIRSIFRQQGLDLLEKNTDKIKALVNGYNQFKDNEDYDPILAEFPETFIPL